MRTKEVKKIIDRIERLKHRDLALYNVMQDMDFNAVTALFARVDDQIIQYEINKLISALKK